MIFVSTGQYKNVTLDENLKFMMINGIKNVELSGGVYDPNLIQTLEKYRGKINFSFHNYFPPPKVPFTLNLATLNEELFNLSKNHIIETIRLASKFNQRFYSFHAGFLIDPQPSELGKKILKKKINDENKATDIFLNRLTDISTEAKKEGIEILIENNVLNYQNYKTFKTNPFMMASLAQSINIVKNFPRNVNILLDLAHLKVTANTLDFSPVEYLEKLEHKIKAYHISDNNGENDSNDLISENSWFHKYIKKDKNFFTLELKNRDVHILKKQIKILERMLK